MDYFLEIAQAAGVDDAPVLCLDNYCVALVEESSDLDAVFVALCRVMVASQITAGSLLLASGRMQPLTLDERRVFAEHGVSLRRANADDLPSCAREMLLSVRRRTDEIMRTRRQYEERLMSPV